MRKTKPKVTGIKLAGEKHAVVSLSNPPTSPFLHRREVCDQCPWRKDSPCGAFPADAYRHSATTAYDMASNMFACHMSPGAGGDTQPTVCAGFLLAGADHNLSVRLAFYNGRYDPGKVRKTAALYTSYRAMAVANGVPEDDPCLLPCRGIDEPNRNRSRRITECDKPERE